jgi:type VI secretion system secreted protein VgrG
MQIGTIHAGDAVALQAQADLTKAYNYAAAMPCDFNLTGEDLGGLTLTPGVYCFDTSAQLTGALALDFQGGSNSSFIFQVGSTLTTASNSVVSLTNCTQRCLVVWQVGSSATLGTSTKFSGDIMAMASITLTTDVNLCGRALALTGAVTMDTDVVFFMGSLTPPGRP